MRYRFLGPNINHSVDGFDVCRTGSFICCAGECLLIADWRVAYYEFFCVAKSFRIVDNPDRRRADAEKIACQKPLRNLSFRHGRGSR